MDEETYISSRVDDQITWYDRKSQVNQRWFKRLRVVEIIAAAAIPLIAGFAVAPFPVTFTVAILGAIIAVISALLSLNQFRDNWTEYRSICESLKREKFLFLTKSDPYHETEPFPLFVQRIESLISKENNAWLDYTRTATAKADPTTEQAKQAG